MLLRAGTLVRAKGLSQSFVQKSVSGGAKEVGGAGRGCGKNDVGSEFGGTKVFWGQLAKGENGRICWYGAGCILMVGCATVTKGAETDGSPHSGPGYP